MLSLNSYRLMLHKFDVDPGSSDYISPDDEILLELSEDLDPKWVKKKVEKSKV